VKAFGIKRQSKSTILFLVTLIVLLMQIKKIYPNLKSNLMVVQMAKIVSSSILDNIDFSSDNVRLLEKGFYHLTDQVDDSFLYWYHMGQLAYLAGEYEKVIALLEPQLQYREFPLSSLMLGSAFWKMNKIDEAILSWRPVKNIGTFFLIQALKAEDERNYQLAEENYQKLLALSPDCSEARSGYLFVHSINLMDDPNSDPLELEEVVIQALSQNNALVSRQLRLGVALYQTRKLELAKIALQRAIAVEPKSHWPKYYLGLVYFAEGDYSDAEEMLLEAVEIAPNYARGHQWLARTMIKLGKNNLALSHYRLAAKLLPDDTALVNEFETFMENMGDSR
jgi:tetratricopeptide (TPR) repeat protein